MKITIVLRTYKRPDFLKQSLSSIHHQTHNNWELIIFDDEGSDENFKIYQNFKLQHPDNRIMYITTKNRHEMYKKSWMLGLKLSEGELFVRLDDDDLLVHDSLEFLSKTYENNPELELSYGSSIQFIDNKLTNYIETFHPHEHEKTRDIWEGYLNGYPYNSPWRFKKDYYDEPQNYTSIIHCSKANIMCSFHVYVIRVKSALKVIDGFEITSNFVDDLEMMGSLEYLGLTHTSIKKPLCFIRKHSEGNLADNKTNINGKTIFNDILEIRDKVEYLRTDNFVTNIYKNKIEGNSKEDINLVDYQNYFNDFLTKIQETNF